MTEHDKNIAEQIAMFTLSMTHTEAHTHTRAHK